MLLKPMIGPVQAIVLTLVMALGSPLVQGGQAASAGFLVRVDVASDGPRSPAACGVAAANAVQVQCTQPDGTAKPVTLVTTTGPAILPRNLQDGWITWASQRGDQGAPHDGLPSELSSRMVTIDGLEFLEMTLSW